MKRSSVVAIVETLESLIESINICKFAHYTLLDLSKAFDNVYHNVFVHMCPLYRLRGVPLILLNPTSAIVTSLFSIQTIR